MRPGQKKRLAIVLGVAIGVPAWVVGWALFALHHGKDVGSAVEAGVVSLSGLMGLGILGVILSEMVPDMVRSISDWVKKG